MLNAKHSQIAELQKVGQCQLLGNRWSIVACVILGITFAMINPAWAQNTPASGAQDESEAEEYQLAWEFDPYRVDLDKSRSVQLRQPESGVDQIASGFKT